MLSEFGCKCHGIFATFLSCYEVVALVCYFCYVAKKFSADYENHTILRNISHIGEMFPSPCKRNVIMAHGRNVLFVSLKKYGLCHMEETCSRATREMLFGAHGSNALCVLQDKCDFAHMVLLFSSCCKRNVVSATSQRC